jgi:hypothetical protein
VLSVRLASGFVVQRAESQPYQATLVGQSVGVGHALCLGAEHAEMDTEPPADSRRVNPRGTPSLLARVAQLIID